MGGDALGGLVTAKIISLGGVRESAPWRGHRAQGFDGVSGGRYSGIGVVPGIPYRVSMVLGCVWLQRLLGGGLGWRLARWRGAQGSVSHW